QEEAESYGRAISLKKAQSDALWYYRQGFCYQSEGNDGPPDFELAENAYQEAIQRDRNLNAARFGIGVFHEQRGYWHQAKEAYSKQIENRPVDAKLYFRLGMAHDRCYEWADAAYFYRKALAIDVNQADWHYRLGFVLERQGKYKEAGLAYQFASFNRREYTPYWFYRWGYVLEKQQRYREAVDAYLRIRPYSKLRSVVNTTKHEEEQRDEDLECSQNRDLIEYLHQLDDYQTVINDLLESLRLDTTDPRIWYQLGNCYEVEESWEKAKDAYRQAIARQNKHTPEWYYRLGYSLSKCGHLKDSAAALRQTRILQRPYGVSEKTYNSNADFREAAKYKEFYLTLPIAEKVILYESFFGKTISCNPYAIFCNIYEREDYKGFTHVWVVEDVSFAKDTHRKNNNVIFIERGSDAYLRYVATAKYLINNSTFPPFFTRRREQFYLNTWHGTPWKTLGKDIKNSFMEHKNTQRNFLQATHIITPNSHTTDVLINRYDIESLYTGRVYESGYPRVDLTLNAKAESKALLKRRLGILDEKPVILYAPTWRGILGKTVVELEEIQTVISTVASCDVHVLFRGHYFVEKAILEKDLEARVAPSELDTNELLSIVDCLITDYSSIAFDFMATGRPIIYYLSDYEEYKSTRGLYFDKSCLPGKVADNTDDLIEVLLNLDYKEKPDENYDLARSSFVPHEDGNASERVVSWFFGGILPEGVAEEKVSRKSHNIIVFGGEFQPNGITSSFINLVHNLNKDKISINVPIDPNAVANSADQLEQFGRVSDSINGIPRVGRVNRTTEEAWLESKLNQYNCLKAGEMSDRLNEMYQHELVRMFGHFNADAVVNFTGYSSFWSYLLGSANKQMTKRKTIFQHNDKYSEWISRFPNLEKTFNSYKYYDKVLSVSEKTMMLNEENLQARFSIASESIGFCDNLQNPSEVMCKAREELSEADKRLFDNYSTIFITMGRLSIEKDHQKLISAFHRVVSLHPRACLLILGDGPLKGDLIRLIKSLSLENSVFLLGRRLNPFPVLMRADCFVLSSNHEGQPMVLFEAMIMKKPIIATDIIGSRSAIEGRSGHLVHNSVQGLADGMLAFISGQLDFPEYNIDLYQKAALEMFYSKACGLGAEYV
ncbi:MAG: CDP-glycerol glycerophosphotransferase family protein, partial [Oceanospirillaceae bacterium]|nr:CDP-glycerol glycerophosphotransferase family protein [Oceanospirillaceae bacterium]